MAGKPKSGHGGEPLLFRGQKMGLTLFPRSFAEEGRELVADPWAYLLSYIETNQRVPPDARERAQAFVRQSRDFHAAADNPQLTSRPLLLYYSFLNLAKAWITLETRKKLERAMHGIGEHRDNFQPANLGLADQQLRISAEGTGQIFRDLMRLCGGALRKGEETIGLQDVLAQVVGVHRTYCRVFGDDEQFYRMTKPAFMRSQSPKGIYLQFYIEKRHFAPNRTFANLLLNSGAINTTFGQVVTGKGDEDKYRLESKSVTGCERVRSTKLASVLQSLRPHLHAALTQQGYRYYIRRVDGIRALPQLAALYAAFFYFGSVTRYHPYDFESIRQGDHGWLVDEFLSTQPLQFAYLCTSHIVRRDIHLPYCAVAT